MAQSDITIDALSKVGQQDAEYLVSLVRSVPGFPKEGIIFRDFMPVLADPKGLKILLKAFEEALPVSPSEFASIAGLESRGFLFGPAMAAHLGKGFIAVRKAGKLPPETIGESYDLEYGTASVEIETDAVQAGKCRWSMRMSSSAAPPPTSPTTLSKRPVAPWWASVS